MSSWTPPAAQGGRDTEQAGKESEMRSAVVSRANHVLDLLIEAVVSALCSLILDGRNQLREVTMSAVYIH